MAFAIIVIIVTIAQPATNLTPDLATRDRIRVNIDIGCTGINCLDHFKELTRVNTLGWRT